MFRKSVVEITLDGESLLTSNKKRDRMDRCQLFGPQNIRVHMQTSDATLAQHKDLYDTRFALSEPRGGGKGEG